MPYLLITIGFIYCVTSVLVEFLEFQQTPGGFDIVFILVNSAKMIWAFVASLVIHGR